MKKKGLIISTVVMVVVLIASLTTATYAWFSSTNSVSVGDITMSVGEGAKVVIGAKTDNTYTETVTADNFMNGSIQWDATANTNKGGWTGGQAGLSTTLSTGLVFDKISKAVSTGDATAGTIDAAWDPTHGVIKANGNGDHTTLEAGSVEAAATNVDYFSIVMGVQALASNLQSVSCVITVDPTDAKTTVGMNAAINVRYRINGGEWVQKDVYDAQHYNTLKTAVTNANTVEGLKVNPGAQSISIPIATADTGSLDVDTIYQLELIVFIDGNDTDCVNAAKGSSSLVHINFVTVDAAETPAP